MNEIGILRDPRAAGGLLVSSLLILIIALVILIASGALPAFYAILQGSLAQVAPYAPLFRLLILLFVVGWIVQLLGFALLTRLLVRTGDEQLAVLAFSLLLVAVIMAVLYSTFRMSVELWAAQEAARTGSIPQVLEPLKAWASSFFRVAYYAYLVAEVGFGWGILRTKILAPWVGWINIGWGVLWLAAHLVGIGVPAIPLIMPAVIGVALLWPRTRPTRD